MKSHTRYEIANRLPLRWFYDWHAGEAGHPYDKPYPDYPDSHWGPRYEWICDLLDWLTGGWMHD